MVSSNLHSHVSQMEIILEISCIGVYSLSFMQKLLPILLLYCGITKKLCFAPVHKSCCIGLMVLIRLYEREEG